MKSATMNLALIRLTDTLPAGDLPYPRVVSCQGAVRQAVIRGETIMVLLDSLQIWTCAFPAQSPLSPVSLPMPVKSMACSDEVCFVVSDSGKVFVWGQDTRETGVMGVPGLFASDGPMHVEDLAKADIVQVSVGTTHAAALDSER